MTETGNPPAPEPAESDEGVRLIRSLKLTNFLSFGPEGEEIELRSLNVLVGANGSGKTNFVEGLGLLAASIDDVGEPVRQGGGVGAWFYKGDATKNMGVEAVVAEGSQGTWLSHLMALSENQQRTVLAGEEIRRLRVWPDEGLGDPVFDSFDGEPRLWDEHNSESRLGVKLGRQSVLSQIRGWRSDRGLGALQNAYERIRLYRSWSFGPTSTLRGPQGSDFPYELLSGSFDNLFLVLQQSELAPGAKEAILDGLRDFLPDVDNFTVQARGSMVQLYVRQGQHHVSAARLSDGTLRWLCLLAILVAPAPPSVIVLEEPELGLHPDMINTLADMLKAASKRHQLVVTTHSDILIDALSDVSEAVMVVEKEESGTTIRRLNAEEMKPWLEEYRLGRLWMQGQIGETRW